MNLGAEIAWSEQGHDTSTIKPYDMHKSLLSPQSLEMIHRMVYQRYSSYNNIIPLYLGRDLEKLLSYKRSTVRSPQGQTLRLFPSIFALELYRQEHSDLGEHTEVLIGSSTIVQKSKAFRNLSTGASHTLLCTHSQMFQNRNNLTHIELMDQHSPYYRSFKDPRYRVKDVVSKLQAIYLS